MSNLDPPFRAEHVGSLLRPPEIKDARAKLERKEISRGDLKEVEDQAVRRAVRKQESLGMKVVTDGEYRRSFWSRDFFRHLDNVETFSTPDVKRTRASSHCAARIIQRPSDGRSFSLPEVCFFTGFGTENDDSSAERIFGASWKDHH
jgi:methionine synthase II (cobalamin-independent)